jgi:electron transfer flavoprotein alpha subunit
VTDITKVIDGSTFQRPVYAGNAISTVKSHDAIIFLAFRATSFDQVVPNSNSNSFVQEKLNVEIKEDKQKLVSQEIVQSEKPELTAAKIVISGGRGMKSKENFNLLDDLANVFGNAAIGASRAAVDAGYIPNDSQVGQTGKVVAPELYIAVGISGAIQHLAGMKDSKVIVAINKGNSCI